MHKKTLFIFRRDLQLEDNTGLNKALEESEHVIPAFIITEQATTKHDHHTQAGLQFMIESLQDLERQLEQKGGKLHYHEGEPETIVKKLIKEEGINAVYANQDYTPYSKRRDDKIRRACKEAGVAFIQTHDTLLNEPNSVKKEDGKPYTKFTPYYRKASMKDVPTPKKNDHRNYETRPGTHACPLKHPGLRTIKGGREEALKRLQDLERYRHYEDHRDLPALDRTTKLSPHLKFGTISAREAYHAIKKAFGPGHDLARQLHWRDFFTQISHHHPRAFQGNFNQSYDDVEWDDDQEKLQAWKDGKTGHPIVDAGMRQLNQTGWMHNRARMIAASFLTKDLHLDWRAGEQYFATRLVDYDPAVNNGNWQWAASTGCDAQPYFRIFNPWRQQKRYDPQAEYIKRWVPELATLSAQQIHALEHEDPPRGYPERIVEHREEQEETLKRFRRARTQSRKP